LSAPKLMVARKAAESVSMWVDSTQIVGSVGAADAAKNAAFFHRESRMGNRE